MTSNAPPKPSDRNAFEIAILCALLLESDAVEAIFDDFWEKDGIEYDKAPGDRNSYTLGRIGRHNVVLAYLPDIGPRESIRAAENFRASFPNIRLGLVVGTCGGVPRPLGLGDEIFLGDVVISTGIVHYGSGAQYSNRVIPKPGRDDLVGRTSYEIRAFLRKMQGARARSRLQEHTSQYLAEIRDRDDFQGCTEPAAGEDKLYRADYRHKHQDPSACAICARCSRMEDDVCDSAPGASCAELGCNDGQLEHRERAVHRLRKVHFGLIASGSLVMKSGPHRDRIAIEEKVIGFEMEGAGVWDSLPTVVIKSVCNYSDGHKNKLWQRYCACVAAAAAKGFLFHWRGTEKPPTPGLSQSNLRHDPEGHWISNSSFGARAHQTTRALPFVDFTVPVSAPQWSATQDKGEVPASRR